MSATFTIGEASASSGLSPDALRYYEEEGIIGPLGRDASNRRRFSESDIAWIGVVTCMREAGLGISELRVFAALLRGGDTSEDPVTFLRGRRAALAARADLLARAIGVLDHKIAYFSGMSAPAAEDGATARVHVSG
ncbi:MerR family transcriptional regulator [Microbacterium lushaniae]|nr:MerR family transcriptional regulator [Microbacterium lushaniae]KAA9150703.1 MerR family transcriptional regulator [Microbacterium lushaniae]